MHKSNFPYCFLPIVFFLGITVSDVSANDFSSAWQGEWSWGNKEPSGTISVYDCNQNLCQFILMSGSSMGVCQLSGKIQLSSVNESVYIPKQKDSPCRVKLTQKNKTLGIEDTGCRDSCGPAGEFGSDYTRYSLVQYFNPSFDCQKAKSKIDIAICGDKELAQLDRNLSNIYRDTITSAKKKDLLKQQRQWIANRNSLCLASVELKKCLKQSYENRINEIKTNSHKQK